MHLPILSRRRERRIATRKRQLLGMMTAHEVSDIDRYQALLETPADWIDDDPSLGNAARQVIRDIDLDWMMTLSLDIFSYVDINGRRRKTGTGALARIFPV